MVEIQTRRVAVVKASSTTNHSVVTHEHAQARRAVLAQKFRGERISPSAPSSIHFLHFLHSPKPKKYELDIGLHFFQLAVESVGQQVNMGGTCPLCSNVEPPRSLNYSVPPCLTQLSDFISRLDQHVSLISATIFFKLKSARVPDLTIRSRNLYNKSGYVCLSVCLSVCSIWPAKRLGRSRPNLTQALMSTQGVFLARSISRSLMYACGSVRKPGKTARKRHLTNDAHTSGRLAQATPSERLLNAVELRNEARRRKAPSSERRSREHNSVRRTGS